jgi:hypothetical protein
MSLTIGCAVRGRELWAASFPEEGLGQLPTHPFCLSEREQEQPDTGQAAVGPASIMLMYCFQAVSGYDKPCGSKAAVSLNSGDVCMRIMAPPQCSALVLERSASSSPSPWQICNAASQCLGRVPNESA